MKKNIKFSKHPLPMSFPWKRESIFLSLRAPLWVRGNLVKCHCELSKKVWQSHNFLYLSSFSVIASPVLLGRGNLIYSYTLIYILLLTTNLFPLYLCYSCSLYVIQAHSLSFLLPFVISIPFMSFPWKRESIFFCHCEPKFIRAWQSHFPLYSNIPSFFNSKTIKKL